VAGLIQQRINKSQLEKVEAVLKLSCYRMCI